MSDNYFDSRSYPPFDCQYVPGYMNQVPSQASFAQLQNRPQIYSNDSCLDSSFFGSPSPSVAIPFGDLQRQMHFVEPSNLVRRVINMGPSLGVVSSANDFHPSDRSSPPDLSAIHHRYTPCDSKLSILHQQSMSEGPATRFSEGLAVESEFQELNFRTLLSQQISKQGFSIRAFLEQKHSSTEMPNVPMAKKSVSIPPLNPSAYADESEEALFAVRLIFVNSTLLKLMHYPAHRCSSSKLSSATSRSFMVIIVFLSLSE
jgi:hypothetical protein